jgi:hypothetical protein
MAPSLRPIVITIGLDQQLQYLTVASAQAFLEIDHHHPLIDPNTLYLALRIVLKPDRSSSRRSSNGLLDGYRANSSKLSRLN